MTIGLSSFSIGKDEVHEASFVLVPVMDNNTDQNHRIYKCRPRLYGDQSRVNLSIKVD